MTHFLTIPFLSAPTLALSIDNASTATAASLVFHVFPCGHKFQITHVIS